MAPSFPRERLSADIATHVMRKLDWLAGRSGFNRTTLITVLINEAYDTVNQQLSEMLGVPLVEDDTALKELTDVMETLEG